MPAEQLYSRSNRELGLGDHAAIAERFHPDPFRTRQLSSLASAIVLRCANSREVVNAAPPSFYCFAVFFVMFFLLSVSFCVVSLVFIFRHDLSGHRPVSRISERKGKKRVMSSSCYHRGFTEHGCKIIGHGSLVSLSRD